MNQLTRKQSLSQPALFILIILCSTISNSQLMADDFGQNINAANVLELQEMMTAGELNSENLTRYYLNRISRYDKHLKSIIAVNPMALNDARRLDEERRQGTVHGRLHGIPVIIKDNIESKEPIPTTAGSLALEHNVTGRDAAIVAKLRAAGAIILAKANLSEWANFRSERSSSGWSGIGGQVVNPYGINRSPCGSSAGTGAAIAAHLASTGVGTETNGSVVCPSSINNLVGIKPTVGLLSRSGIVPLSHSQDTAGPMTRTVTDAAVMLSIMDGYDSKDQITKRGRKYSDRDYTKNLNINGLQGKRIGVLRSSLGNHEAVNLLFDQSIATLRAEGAEIIDDLSLEGPDGFRKSTYDILLYEFKHDINQYLAGLPNEYNSLTLAKLIEFNERHADREMPYFKQEIFVKAQAKGDLNEKDYKDAVKLALKVTQKDGIDKLLAEHKLDALIASTVGPSWPIDKINGDPSSSGGYSTFSAVSGYPHITVPMGFVHGLPVGISFVAGAFSEPLLIEIAYDYEQASGHRRDPILD